MGPGSKALWEEGTQDGLYFLQSCQVWLQGLIPAGKPCSSFIYLAFLGAREGMTGAGGQREQQKHTIETIAYFDLGS